MNSVYQKPCHKGTGLRYFAALMICFCGDVKVVRLAADKKIPASLAGISIGDLICSIYHPYLSNAM